MKPFHYKKQSEEQRIYSYRLSRARRVVENAFGIMANCFRILQTPVRIEPNKAVQVVLACTVLHNYLRKEYADDYVGLNGFDREHEEGVLCLKEVGEEREH